MQLVLLAAVWWLSRTAETEARLPTQRQVADHAEVDVMMTSQVLRALAARGAIAVVANTDAAFFSRVHDPRQLLGVLHQLDHGTEQLNTSATEASGQAS